jgi:hypothetical protein
VLFHCLRSFIFFWKATFSRGVYLYSPIGTQMPTNVLSAATPAHLQDKCTPTLPCSAEVIEYVCRRAGRAYNSEQRTAIYKLWRLYETEKGRKGEYDTADLVSAGFICLHATPTSFKF